MIEFLDEQPPRSDFVLYVGGPKAGQREPLGSHPALIAGSDGAYRRSLSCTDDGDLRYVWTRNLRTQSV